MASALETVLPLIEQFKTELSKLDTATSEIEKYGKAAELHNQSADAVTKAARNIAAAHDELVGQLAKQQRNSLHDQQVQLQTHLDTLTHEVTAEVERQLQELRGGAQAAMAAADSLLTQQPAVLTAIETQYARSLQQQEAQLQAHLTGLTTVAEQQLAQTRQATQAAQATSKELLTQHPLVLAAIRTQHRESVMTQTTELQKSAQAWASLLHQQMQAELAALRQVTETLHGNMRQQHGDLSAITDQLQIATGRITAFAEALNAARFLTKLEGLETGQREARQALHQLDTYSQAHRQQAEASQQATTATLAQLTARQAASEDAQARQQAAWLAALDEAVAQQQAVSRQLRLLQVLSLVASAVLVGLVCYFK